MPGTIGGELSYNPFMRTAVPAVRSAGAVPTRHTKTVRSSPPALITYRSLNEKRTALIAAACPTRTAVLVSAGGAC